MGGKLNYNSRKSTGTKLGNIVQKDILKLLRASPKPPKNCHAKDSHLELCIEDKDLLDEGLQIVSRACIQALWPSPTAVKLDELSLARNKITIHGLRHLSPVIRLAAKYIKDLDLRGNAIAVDTPEAEEIWETFLRSFKNVCSLRRLDLSGNPLGDKAIEILWRVYTREEPIHIPRLSKVVISDSSDDEYDSDGDIDPTDAMIEQARWLSMGYQADRKLLGSSSHNSSPTKSAKDIPSPSSAASISPGSVAIIGLELHGLRSVPYLALSDTGTTDASALYLSYIVCQHPILRRITPFLSLPRSNPYSGQYSTGLSEGCQGIVYRPNSNMTVLSEKVLSCAEYIRDPHYGRREPPTFSRQRRLTSEIQHSTPLSKGRRDSMTEPSVAFAMELERARNKIQGAILRTNGVQTVDIWKTALRAVVLGRVFAWNNGNAVDASHPMTNEKKSQVDWPVLSNTSRAGLSPCSDASTLAIDSPVLYPIPGPPRFVTSLNLNTVYNDAKLPGGLPLSIWTRIISMAVDSKMILTDRQIEKAIEWGGSRTTLDKERAIVGKLRSQQIWHVLEAIECLAYE